MRADAPKSLGNVRQSFDYKYPTGRTAPAFTAAFPPTMLVPRRTPLSLNLGSLDHFAELFPARQI